MWYVAVTGPTTGYGDLYPTMSMGKSLGTFLCLCTMLVLAFPVTIIAKNMSERYSAITNPITPESPYKLQSLIWRQVEMKRLWRSYSTEVKALIAEGLVSVDDAYWLTFHVQKIYTFYEENKMTGEGWGDAMIQTFAFLSRQSEAVRDRLRPDLLWLAKASLE